MSITDWESRELEEASRERLLTEIGALRQTFDTSNIEELNGRIVELKRELLAVRDFAMGAAAQAEEQQAQLFAQSAQSTSRIGEPESELMPSREQVVQTKHELLAARDFAMGAAAQAGELQAQLFAQSAQSTSRIGEPESELMPSREQVVQTKHELLVARDFAMGVAAQAGELQAQLYAQNAQLAAVQERIVFLAKHINQMRNSTTWKLGRIAMLPARIAKRILPRSS